jgi:hypothetical protein
MIKPCTYNDLATKFDAFSKSIVELEQAFPFSNHTVLLVGKLHYDSSFQPANIFGSAGTLYFVLAATIEGRGKSDTPKLIAREKVVK